MEQLIQELHSSCVAASVAPVLSTSDNTTLKFVSQFGSAPWSTRTSTSSRSSQTAIKPYNDLVDKVYTYVSGTPAELDVRDDVRHTKTLAENVSQASVNGVTQPYFQYFSYANGASRRRR